jgi:hypothetical protein
MNEFENFDNMMRKLVRVSHDEALPKADLTGRYYSGVIALFGSRTRMLLTPT